MSGIIYTECYLFLSNMDKDDFFYEQVDPALIKCRVLYSAFPTLIKALYFQFRCH